MPRTKAGNEALANYVKKYGPIEGKKRYYASIVKGNPGTEKWEGGQGSGRLAKARSTYKRKHGK